MIDNGRLVAIAYGVERRPGWRKAAHDWLKDHGFCLVCGDKTKPQVHHQFPWHLCVLLGRPDLELDKRNFATLCEQPDMEHHLLIGHLGNWESYNPNLYSSVSAWRSKPATELLADKTFQLWMATRPKPWAAMTDDDKAKLRADMDRLMPLIPTKDKA